MIPWSITKEEMSLAQECMSAALEYGASAVRVSFNKSVSDIFKTLNGQLDKVTHSFDRSLTFNLFSEGRFGSFSINRTDKEEVKAFIKRAVETVGILAPDKFRVLPEPARTARNALTGLEAGLYDESYAEMTVDKRISRVLESSFYKRFKEKGCDKYKIISEESEYSDSISDSYIIDSNGLSCRHIETSFETGCEVTIEDSKGNKYTGFWWDASPFLEKVAYGDCGPKALERAAAQIAPAKHKGGRFNMVVENEVASRLVSPLLSALNAYSLQQNNSFLLDTLGKKIFPEGLNIEDRPLDKGCDGAKLFDSEGVAAENEMIIENGVVKRYFVNTYMSGKMGIAPTIEEAIRPCLMPYWTKGTAPERIGVKELIESCRDGIMVTGFNGGNSNSSTGDFSYGIEGFVFKDGKIGRPVRGMVITGNFIELWNNILAAGNDSRKCMHKQIPSLAFANVDFSA